MFGEKSLGFLATRFSIGELFLTGENQKLVVIWSKSRLRRNFQLVRGNKVNCYLVVFQASQQPTREEEINYYLVGF